VFTIHWYGKATEWKPNSNHLRTIGRTVAMNTANTETHDTKTADKAAPAGAGQAPSAVPPQEAHTQDLQPDAPPRPAEGIEARARRPRGFAAIDRKLLAEIASKGGKAAHSAGTAHEFTSAEAREAGRKGGLATHAKRRKAGE
jgi:general stress protein YciG